MKAFLYFVAAIFIGLCVYAFVEGVTVITVEQQQQAAEGASLVEESDTATAKPCEEEGGFWAEYNVWGNTDTLYGPAESTEAVEGSVDENISCDELFEDGINQ